MNDSLRAARVATFVYFSLCGTLMGTWVVNIPAIEERVGITHATLGGLLVLLGLGAFIGMQVAGRLTDSLGARIVVPTTGVLCSAALVLPGLPRDPWTLAGALLAFGFCNGCLDVSMNAHAVHVEKAYGRPSCRPSTPRSRSAASSPRSSERLRRAPASARPQAWPPWEPWVSRSPW